MVANCHQIASVMCASIIFHRNISKTTLFLVRSITLHMKRTLAYALVTRTNRGHPMLFADAADPRWKVGFVVASAVVTTPRAPRPGGASGCEGASKVDK